MGHQKSLQDFYTSLLGFLLSTKRQLISIAKDHDLTFIQATTLMLTDIDIPKPMNALQKLYSCDASNITGIIDGLEEKGLVKRGEDLNDRRVKIISLTKKGVILRDKIYADLVELDNTIVSGLDKTELVQFRSIIARLSLNY